jgi:putative FmdB family regulatory protein
MPIYEYQCQACEQQSEFIMKISDPTPSACTHCSSGPLKKLMSPTSFVLKGEGWYETDFKGKKSKDSKATEPKEESSRGKKEEATAPQKKEPASSKKKETTSSTT